jgi:glycosyltransferase involved in cell wall biosynthesis
MCDYVDSNKISIIPNGVDLPSFPFHTKKKVLSENITFLFVGNFSWIQNRDALGYLLKDIWPAVRLKYSKAMLRIVGKHIPSALLSSIDTAHTTLLEFVDSIQGELQNADIMLAPIRIGGGTKYKILEAQASGLPVITTTLGACGMGLVNGKQVMIADTIPDVLEAVEILLNEKSRALLVTAARAHIEEHYSWDIIAKSLDQTWQEAYGQSR